MRHTIVASNFMTLTAPHAELDRQTEDLKKRWVFGAAAGAIWPPSSNEAEFSKNVWESGAPSAPRNTHGGVTQRPEATARRKSKKGRFPTRRKNLMWL